MTITIADPELARMFEESGAPSTDDIPGAVCLGRTEDGRTRKDFEDEVEFEMNLIMRSIKFATIGDLDAHLAYEGKKARAAYLGILRLTMIRDKMMERAGGDPEAMFLETMNGYLADHEGEATDA